MPKNIYFSKCCNFKFLIFLQENNFLFVSLKLFQLFSSQARCGCFLSWGLVCLKCVCVCVFFFKVTQKWGFCWIGLCTALLPPCPRTQACRGDGGQLGFSGEKRVKRATKVSILNRFCAPKVKILNLTLKESCIFCLKDVSIPFCFDVAHYFIS